PHHIIAREHIDQRSPDCFGLRIAVHQNDSHDQPRCADCGSVGTTMTVGPSALSTAVNSCASFSVLSTLTARQPKPDAMEAMSSPGRSRPGTPGVFSNTAKDLRIEYSP